MAIHEKEVQWLRLRQRPRNGTIGGTKRGRSCARAGGDPFHSSKTERFPASPDRVILPMLEARARPSRANYFK